MILLLSRNNAICSLRESDEAPARRLDSNYALALIVLVAPGQTRALTDMNKNWCFRITLNQKASSIFTGPRKIKYIKPRSISIPGFLVVRAKVPNIVFLREEKFCLTVEPDCRV